MIEMGYRFPDNWNYVISQINLTLNDTPICLIALCKIVFHYKEMFLSNKELGSPK